MYGGGRDRVSLYRIHEAAATVSPLETKTHALPMGQTLKEDDGKSMWWFAPYE